MFVSLSSLSVGSYFVTLDAQGKTSGERYLVQSHDSKTGRSLCQKVGGDNDGQEFNFLSSMLVFA